MSEEDSGPSGVDPGVQANANKKLKTQKSEPRHPLRIYEVPCLKYVGKEEGSLGQPTRKNN